MLTIIVTRAGTACPVAPCPDTPETERRISDTYNRQYAITLAKSPPVQASIKANPVPKGWMK